MHSSHSDRGTGVCLASSRQTKPRFPARSFDQKSRLEEQATAATVSLPQISRNYSAKNRVVSNQDNLQWSHMQPHQYAIQGHNCLYEREGVWGEAGGEEKAVDIIQQSHRRHVGGYDVVKRYPNEIEEPLSVQRHYEASSSFCNPPVLPSHSLEKVEETYTVFNKRTESSNVKAESKSAAKFPWMKNTKSHHFEWKAQWERGKFKNGVVK